MRLRDCATRASLTTFSSRKSEQITLMERPEISQFTSLDFKEWHEAGTLLLTPKFQRREVWKPSARSFFIDSLLRDVPIPPIFLRLAQSEDRKRAVREVVDGQQRLRTV